MLDSGKTINGLIKRRIQMSDGMDPERWGESYIIEEKTLSGFCSAHKHFEKGCIQCEGGVRFMLINECMATVDTLNELFIEQVGDNDKVMNPFEFFYCTDGFGIRYLEQVIWISEDDDRIYSDEDNKYEPMIDLIKRKVKEFNSIIAKCNMDVELTGVLLVK
jgi:hypothetical protein